MPTHTAKHPRARPSKIRSFFKNTGLDKIKAPEIVRLVCAILQAFHDHK